MIDPITGQLIIAGGAGLLNTLMGKDDNMSPEQRKVWQMLMGDLGEAKNVQGRIDATTQSFKQQANQINASEDASMARRGMPVSPGQTALAHADTNASFGTALSKAIPQIQRDAKSEQMDIYSKLAGLAPQGNNDNSWLSDAGDLAGNAMYYYLMKGKKPDSTTGYDPFKGYNMRPKFQIPRL